MAQNRNLKGIVPPHDLDAEKSVIGGLLIDKDAIVNIVEFLRPHHFYLLAHQDIFKAILTLYEQRNPFDLITVPDQLRKDDSLDKIGGVSYLTELVNFVPTAANIENYAEIIKEHFVRRSLINAASSIAEVAHSGSEINEILDKAEQSVFAISQDKTKSDFSSIKEILEVTFERLDDLSQNRGSLRGVPTGFKTMDKMLSGLKSGELVILAARPSVGKSSMAINIAQHAITNAKKGVAYFSLEMGKDSIVERMVSAEGDIDNWRITTGNLEPSDFEKYAMASAVLSEANFHIDDTPGISPLEIRTKARRLSLENEIDLVVVDYLQLMRGTNKESRVQEIAEISQSLKHLARELEIPVLALSQLSRAVEQRGGDKRPQLSDLRDSGSIEQDADVVIFLYRPDEENRENIKMVVAKNRNGPTGDVDLFFKGDRTKFFEVQHQNTET
jgi:replicative DNA helicase